jgi:hypothetical protein
LMVPLSKSGVRKHRGFESRPLRQTSDRWRRRSSASGLGAGPALSGERSPSGLWRRTGNAVRGNPSRVRIPPSPPLSRCGWTPMAALAPSAPRSRTGGCARSGARTPPCPRRPIRTAWAERTPMAASGPSGSAVERPLLDLAGRARWGTSGALNLQSAPAGLNSLSRSPSSVAAGRRDVEDRVPRSGEPRTVSGPEGSSTKRSSSGAAERPGPSRPAWWARGRGDRRRVHGNSALDRPRPRRP